MLASWNIRGFNDPAKQSIMKQLIANRILSVMGIIETRVRLDNVFSVRMKVLLPNCMVVDNYAYSPLGKSGLCIIQPFQMLLCWLLLLNLSIA